MFDHLVILTDQEAELIRQWYNAICDITPQYFHEHDHALGRKIKDILKADFAVPPGETIKELMEVRRMSCWALASHLKLSVGEILNLCDGTLKISQTVAEDLEQVFGMTADFWLNLQAQYDAAKKGEGK